MLVLGALFGLATPTLTTAAVLSVPSLFLRGSSGHPNPDCATTRRNLESPLGDPLTLLNIFDSWVQVRVVETAGADCLGAGKCLKGPQDWGGVSDPLLLLLAFL